MNETKRGEVVPISNYLRTCEQCKYHDKPNTGACGFPGGWEADPRHDYRCISFQRKEVRQDAAGDKRADGADV